MPLLSRGKKDKIKSVENGHHDVQVHNNNNNVSKMDAALGEKPAGNPAPPLQESNSANNGQAQQQQNPPFSFFCQQAHGSPTGKVSNFSNVRELYERIANCYDFPVDDILFCTLNTHRVDMDNLLSAQLCLEDFIFVHRKGNKKQVTVTKTEEALGLTITDNGTGYAFIKRIKEDSIMHQVPSVQVGDHIEGIDEQNLVGWRHVEVAKYLKGIPVGTTFTMKLVEPLRAGFANIAPKSEKKINKGYGNGKGTIRLTSKGTAKVQDAPTELVTIAVDKINRILETFMGINDVDLATQIWEMAEGKSNTMDFAEAIDNSELESFGFSDDHLIEIWGIVTDAKAGRIKPEAPSNLFADDDINEEDLARLMMKSTPSKKQHWQK